VTGTCRKPLWKSLLSWLVVCGLVTSAALAGHVHAADPAGGTAALPSLVAGDAAPSDLPVMPADHVCCTCAPSHGTAMLGAIASVPAPTMSDDLFPAAHFLGAAIASSTPRRPPRA
jgi:hypothetical protein